MPLRIPSDASLSVQQALRELDQKKADVSATVDGLSEDDVRKIIREEFARAVTGSSSPSTFPPLADIMRPSGPAHMYGYAPDPDSSGGTDQVLHEDASWKWPLSGNLQDISSLVTPDAIKKYQLSGGLSLLGPLAAASGWFDALTVEGLLLHKPYFCRLWNSADISANPSATLTFNTERYNSFGMHSLTANTSRITAPRTGLMIFGGGVLFAANATGYRQLYVSLNVGATIIATEAVQAITVAAITTQLVVAGAYPVTAGDYIELNASQGSGGALNVTSGSDYSPHFWGLLIPTV